MKYPVITLCGSTKFKEQYTEMVEKLTLEGNVVISVGLFGHADKKYNNISEEDKKLLDDIHLQKIDMADIVYIINVNDYIGESTKREIDYAKSKNKIIKYYENND